MKLSDYVLLPRKERMGHIDLSSPCEMVPSTRWTRQKRLDFFGVENDVLDHRKAGINRCHACDNGQHRESNGRVCHNPLHFYIGTCSENSFDIDDEKRGAGGRAVKGLTRAFTEEHKKNISKSAQNRQKFRCLITGVVMPPGNLSQFQLKRNIDTSLREPVK